MCEKCEQVKAEGKLLCDSLTRANIVNIALLGLTQRDLENLRVLHEASPRIKNYAVLTRNLIAKEAKRIRECRDSQSD